MAFTALVRAEQRFVAVGNTADRVVVLDSEDGLTWHRGADLGARESVTVAALATGPRGLVAVGTISFRPASWVSEDGLVWRPRTEPFPMPVLGTDTATVTGVITNGDGWIAVGREDPACEVACGVDPVRGLAWTSRDGLAWTRVTDQPALEGGGMDSIVRMGAGFVATGIDARHAAVWTSTDGATWSRVPDEPLFHAQPETNPSVAVGMRPTCRGARGCRGLRDGVGRRRRRGPGGGGLVVRRGPDLGERDGHRREPGRRAPPRGYRRRVPGDRQHGPRERLVPNRLAVVRRPQLGTIPAGSAPDGFDPVAVAASQTVEVAAGSRGATVPAWWRPVP